MHQRILGLLFMACGFVAGLICWQYAISEASRRTYVLAELTGGGSSYALAFRPETHQLLVGGTDQNASGDFVATYWDVENRKSLWQSKSGVKSQIANVACNPNGKRFAIASDDGEVHVLDNTGQKMDSFWQYEERPTDLRYLGFLDEGRVLAVDHRGGGKLFDCITKHAKVYFWDTMNPYLSVAFYDLKGRVLWWSDGLAVWCCDMRIGGDTKKVGIAVNPKCNAYRWSFNEARTQALIVESNGRLILLDIVSGALVKDWFGHGSDVFAVATIPQGRLYVTGDSEGIIKVWDERGNEVVRVRLYESAIGAIAVSDDAKLMATGGENQPVVVWNLKKMLAEARK
jgi:WD40 repeat protein